MKMLPPCASAARASGPTARPTATRTTIQALSFMGPSGLMRKRPQAELLLGDLPEPREAVRLHDQEEEDEAAEDHHLDLLHERHRQVDPQRVRRVGEEDGHHHDE